MICLPKQFLVGYATVWSLFRIHVALVVYVNFPLVRFAKMIF